MKKTILAISLALSSISAMAADKTSYACEYTESGKKAVRFTSESGESTLKAGGSLGMWGGPLFEGAGSKLYVYNNNGKLGIRVVLMSAASLDFASADTKWGNSSLELVYPSGIEYTEFDGVKMPGDTKTDKIVCIRIK